MDLSAVAAALVEVYEPAAEEAGHALSCHLPRPSWSRGDRDPPWQVIANLFENAIRHTPAGSLVDVSGVAAAAQDVLAVRDDGPRRTRGRARNVLRRLYRLEGSRTSEGSGLGLRLVGRAVARTARWNLPLSNAEPGLAVPIAYPEGRLVPAGRRITFL